MDNPRPQLTSRLFTGKLAQVVFIDAHVGDANNLVVNFPVGACRGVFPVGKVFASSKVAFAQLLASFSTVPAIAPDFTSAVASGRASTPNTGMLLLLCAFSASTAPIAMASLLAITTSILLAFGPESGRPFCLSLGGIPHRGIQLQLLGLQTFIIQLFNNVSGTRFRIRMARLAFQQNVLDLTVFIQIPVRVGFPVLGDQIALNNPGLFESVPT